VDEPSRKVADYLASHRVAVIATTDGERPWASTVYYAAAGFDLVINTPASTRMLRNIHQKAPVAYAIDERVPDLFLQGEGDACELARGSDWDQAAALLGEKVPEAHVGAPGFTIVKVATRRLVLSDFREGFRPPLVMDFGGQSRGAEVSGHAS